MPRNIWVLFIAQCCAMCAAPLVVFVGGLVGRELASISELATLPLALMVVGTAAAVYPAAILAQSIGRKRLFMIAMLLGCGASVLAGQAVAHASFLLFIIAAMLLGAVIACVQQFRFAAMESVDADQAPVAISRLLLAGIVAAYVGPELVVWGSDWGQFEGGFYLLAVLYVIAAMVLGLGFEDGRQLTANPGQNGKHWSVFLRQPGILLAMSSAAIGFAIMSYIMTATPLSMTGAGGLSIEDTKWVIQSHIMAMFLPSLISGWLIAKFGFRKLIFSGVLIYAICIAIAWIDQTLIHYWLALIFLGLGWNFLFVSGTALLPRVHQPEDSAQVQGLNDLLVFGAQAIASLSSGALLILIGWHGLLLSIIPLLLVLCYQLWQWPMHDQN